MTLGEKFIGVSNTVATITGITAKGRVKYVVQFAGADKIYGPWIVSETTFKREFPDTWRN